MGVEDAGLQAAVNELGPVGTHLPIDERRRIIRPRPDEFYAIGCQESLPVSARCKLLGSAVRYPDVRDSGSRNYDSSRPPTSAGGLVASTAVKVSRILYV